jgi:murein DD-endopeptidase MepM/ murein hydrolase activator NlpD
LQSGKIWFAIACFLLIVPLDWGLCFGGQDTWRVEGIPSSLKQGDVFRIRLTGDGGGVPSGDFRGEEIAFYPQENGKGFEAVVGVDLECPAGIYRLNITVEGGSGVTGRVFQIEVAKAFFGVQRITLPEELVHLDSQSLKRVTEERRRMEALWAVRSENRRWHGEFLAPVEGRINAFFGVSRILNGERRGRHNGIDIKAQRGEKVLCPNDGRVVMVDEIFFGGRTAVVDHGQQMFSFYMHLDRVVVRMNQEVRKGDVIGTVGATGRATGPHLHWGVRLNGARVDPLSLMEATTNDRKAIQIVRKRRYMAENRKKETKNGENLGQGGKTLD